MADADRRTVRSVDSMKVADLAAELQKRGLNKSGKKADLVRRLKKAIEQEKAAEDMEVQSRMGPVTASTVEEVSAEGEEDPQPDSTSGDKLQVTSSSEVVKKQVDGGDMDTLEVHPVDNELRDLVHEDGTCASTGGEMPAKRRRLDVKKEEADPGVSSLSTFTNSDGISQLQKAAVKPTALDEESLSSKPEPDSHRHSLSSPLLTPTGHTRRSISMEVDDDYEKQRIQKEKEREELRQQIEARKKEEARLAAKEAEEKRHQRELEREAKRHHREQERLSKQDELLVKQIEEKKRIEDIRKEAKERRLLGDTPVAKPEAKLELPPPQGSPSHILHIINLTRPFTQPQLEELLNQEGGLVPGKIWTDKRKSHCYSAFYTVSSAVSVAERVHGLKWPSHNKRHLEVEYATHADAYKGSECQFEPPDPLSSGDTEGDFPGTHEQGEETTQGVKEDGEKKEIEEKTEAEQSSQEGIPEEALPKEERVEQVAPQEEDNLPQTTEAPDDEQSPLDKLFRKTKSSPHIYWLPLTEELAKEKEHRKAQMEKRRSERERAEQSERERGQLSERERGQRSERERGQLSERERGQRSERERGQLSERERPQRSERERPERSRASPRNRSPRRQR